MTNPFGTKTKAKADPFDTGAPAAAPKGDPFSITSGGSDIDRRINDFVDELLLVKPTEDIDALETINGTVDVVRADVTVLSGPDAGETFADLLVFQVLLKRELRRVMGNPEHTYKLGRLVMGTASKGKSAPYQFADPTPEEVAIARAHLGL
jgi:hypothetical protein